MNLTNRRIVITGASRGLGAALARQLARKDARLLLVGRNATALRAVAEETHSQALVADIGEPPSARTIASAAHALWGGVDVLIHNAAVLGPPRLVPLLDTTDADMDRALEVNFAGPFRLTRALASAMALQGHGLVVHLTSDAGESAYPEWGAYGVSKAALAHLGRIWATELEAHGVRFLNFDPGEMDTLLHAQALPDADRSKLLAPDTVAGILVARMEQP